MMRYSCCYYFFFLSRNTETMKISAVTEKLVSDKLMHAFANDLT